jgi:hypothetical protein
MYTFFDPESIPVSIPEETFVVLGISKRKP